MPLRSYYVFHAGVVPPEQVSLIDCKGLLALNDLWSEARALPPSLLFRVRAEGDIGEALTPKDRLESAVGIVDAVVRWRAVFAMLRMNIMSIRHPALADICQKTAEYLATRHPSSISDGERRMAAQAIGQAAESEMGPRPTSHEMQVAMGLTRLVFADSDADACGIVPMLDAATVGLETDDERRDRVTSVETLASAVLLVEAAQRLAERAPVWLSAPMPGLGKP